MEELTGQDHAGMSPDLRNRALTPPHPLAVERRRLSPIGPSLMMDDKEIP